jgi:hypothetical protein
MNNLTKIPESNMLSIVVGILFAVSLSLAGRANADVGAYMTAQGTFTDVVTGIEINLDLSAEEDLGEGYGHTRYLLSGLYAPGLWAIRSCSTTGGSGADGTFPLTEIRCGGNGRMSVSINNCKADIETHAYVHSDVPFVMYNGQTTTEVAIKQKRGEWHVRMSMYTPKSTITLKGPFTGQVFISNCQ